MSVPQKFSSGAIWSKMWDKLLHKPHRPLSWQNCLSWSNENCFKYPILLHSVFCLVVIYTVLTQNHHHHRTFSFMAFHTTPTRLQNEQTHKRNCFRTPTIFWKKLFLNTKHISKRISFKHRKYFEKKLLIQTNTKKLLWNFKIFQTVY